MLVLKLQLSLLKLQEEVTMDGDGMYVCVDCGHKTENRGNWFKHRRKHLGKYVYLE